VAVLLATLAIACAGPARKPGGGVAVRLDVGGTSVDAQVVSTHEARRRGLMGVTDLGASAGMLFVYPSTERRSFWMQGCLIPLDIAFLDGEGTVVQVDTLEPPSAGAEPARTRLSPPAAYVLEVRAGFFDEHGLAPAVRVLIPTSVDRSRADP